MALSAGTRLGPYEILAPLGAGGMGEVYRATDTKLGREVAIKTLPSEVTGDSERLARFQREAHLLASLNHPHIAAIYGLEEADGKPFLVLELVEGEDLAERLKRGRVPIDEALEIAKQIAEGLEEAHAKGIVHRDLKPANVKLTPDGKAKVLDFGLAKAYEGDPPSGGSLMDLSQSPTLARTGTLAGVILGTAAYMSPEQARGKVVDKRADVWAFGVVLYEMLTGKKAFEAEDVSLTLAEVMKSEPDWNALPAGVSPMLRTYLRRCLEKDPKQRVRDIGDVRLAMDGAFESAAQGTQSADSRPGTQVRPMVLVGVAGLLVGAALSGVAVQNLRPVPTPSVSRFSIKLASPLLDTMGPPKIAISPDGKTAVYAGADRLYRRDLAHLDARPLPNTEGGATPFFSPDGQWVGFVANELAKVSLAGGPAVKLGKANIRGASWGPDGTIVFGVLNSGLSRVSAAGGEPQALTTLAEGEDGHYRPHFLPGGKALLFTIWSGSLETAQIAVLSMDSGEYRPLVGGTYPRYAPSGHVVFAREDSLWVVPFDVETLEAVGDPVPVVEGVQVDPAFGSAQFDLAGDGTLLYATGRATGNTRTLVWVDRAGREEPLTAEPRRYTYPRISPDGTRIALEVRDRDNDIWIWNIARETLTRLTFDPTSDRNPTWTADGAHVAFGSRRGGTFRNLHWKAADGTGAVRRLNESENVQVPLGFLRDGRLVFRDGGGGNTRADLGLLTPEGGSEVLLATEFDERNAEISPDGNWLAYQSDASGQDEIYVRPFPDVDEGRWQISSTGGTRPLWAPDGRELFYLAPGGIVAVPIQTEPNFAAGNATVAYDGDVFARAGAPGRTYDISPDGERFLIVKPVDSDGESPTELIIVQNLFEELKRLAPAEN